MTTRTGSRQQTTWQRAVASVALLSAIGATGTSAAAAAPDASSCAARQPQIERLLQRGREACLERVAKLGADFEACEALQIERWGERMRRAGCDLGDGVDATLARRPGAATGKAWVELRGEAIEVAYTVVGDLAVYQGDMVLGTVPEVRDGDRRIRARLASGVDLAGVKSHTRGAFGWSRNVVPFEIASDVPQATRDRITAAVTHWNSNTIVRLQARNGESDFVRFVKHADSCLSPVGKQGGMQQIKLGPDCSTGNAIHEIGHSVGLFHEQNRSDRDQFVVVLLENIEDDAEDQYEKGPSGSVARGAFDFNSRMLYRPDAFSDNGEDTMTKLDGSTWTPNLTVLSTGDIVGVTRMVTGLNGLFTPKDKFRNKSANRCMDGDTGGAGAGVSIRACDGTPRQRWHLYTHPRTARKLLLNERSGMCLEVPGSSATSGRDLAQFPCHGGSNQAFTFTERPFPWDPWRIRNVGSGLCAALESTANGGDVEQRTCGTSDQQRWFQELL